jgi:lysozyme family protein
MRDSFPQSVALVLSLEGGYVDNAADPGGPTNFGITLATLARARGAAVTAADVRALRRDEATQIYRRLYWDAAGADALPAGIDLAVFDCAVHSGPRRAVLMLQEQLGVTTDGVCGPLTAGAARRCDALVLLGKLEASRRTFLGRLPGAPVFIRGWRSRVTTVHRAARAMARANTPPSPQKEAAMSDTKSILSSRTVWSNLVGLAAIGLSLGGFDVAGFDSGPLVDAGLQVVAGASFVASTLFRVLATRKLAAGA